MILYRPVGLLELWKLMDLDSRGFPPRLPEQPVFYPVLEAGYAVEIAARWNPPDEFSGYSGWVTRFRLPDAFVAPYPVKTVGARRHRELWIPAEDVPAMNAALEGPIEVIDGYIGARFAEATAGRVVLPEGQVPPEALAGVLAQLARIRPELT